MSTIEAAPPATTSAPSRRLPPPRRRLRRVWYLLATLLIVCGALGAFWASQRGQVRHPVLAAAKTIPAGSTIDREDLRVVGLADTTGLATIASSDLTTILGRQTSAQIPAGSLLSEEALRATPLAKGESIVGLALTPAQRPSVDLTAGDKVTLIATPAEQGEPPATAPKGIAGIVVSTTGVRDTADVVVNVRVGQGQANLVAALAATKRIALILNPEVAQ